jgi:thiosulfate/3-mercaptopyruvate sulfurtransferase
VSAEPAAYANAAALVDAAACAAPHGDSIRLVEVSASRRSYDEGHIPGACWWDWRADLWDGGRRDLVARERLEAALSRSGVTPDTRVVLYGDTNNAYAAYAYWVLRLRGLRRVALLDGSKSAWARLAGAWTSREPAYEPTGYRLAGPELASARAGTDLVAARLGIATLLDVRSPEEHAGLLAAPEGTLPSPSLRAGRVPGAAHALWTEALREDGTFRPAAELRRLYAKAGVEPGREVIVYCRSGKRSAHTWFVLTELLGHPAVRNYDASWLEWAGRPDTPIETGAA